MKKNLTVRSVLVHLLVFASLLLVSCNQDAPPPAQEPASAALPVSVITPLSEKVVEWDEYTGRFRASQRVEVKARVSGFLEAVNFEDGAEVEQGDVLFVIDDRPFQIAMDSAQATYEVAKKEFERGQDLRESNAISQEQFDRRRQEMRIAEAAFRQTQLDMEFTRVIAPVSGRVGRNLVDEGNLISASNTLLTTIVATQPIDFYFEGSESDVLKYIRLTKSQKRRGERGGPWPVAVRLQDEDSFIHKGSINYVGNELDIDTGTLEIRAQFANEEQILEPGMFGRLRISTTEPFDALLIPDKLIFSEQTRKYAYVVGEENRAMRRYLTLGALHGEGLRIVKDGLTEDDQVIAGNLQMIQPGMQVMPVSQANKENPESPENTENQQEQDAPQADAAAESPESADTTAESGTETIPEPEPEPEPEAQPDRQGAEA